MKPVTVNQSHAVMAALATNVDWSVLDGNILQNGVVLNAVEAGKQFTAFLANGAVMVRLWRKQDGVIYFSVTSDGTTGPQWIDLFAEMGVNIGEDAKKILLSENFKPTTGVTTKMVVFPGELFKDEDLVTSKIRVEAGKRHLVKPGIETACLIRRMFSDEEIKAMGLWWIVVFHEAVEVVGSPNLLAASRLDSGPWLHACYGKPGSRWNRAGGFAFAEQVSPT